MDYPLDFALSLWIPFTGNAGALICMHQSTMDDWLSNPENWLAQPQPDGTRYMFSVSEMGKLWEVLVIQKLRIQALWMVDQGRSASWDQATAQLATRYPILNFTNTNDTNRTSRLPSARSPIPGRPRHKLSTTDRNQVDGWSMLILGANKSAPTY